MGVADSSSPGRLGLLGGTFDPPHVGHLWLAETARDQLELDEVLLLPVGDPPHKQENPPTAVSHRQKMLQLALQNAPQTRLDTTDADRPPPHTTATLLPLLHEEYPQAQFWWIIGSDSLRDFPTWHEPQQILRQCRLAVLARPGVELDWPTLETAVPGLRATVDWLHGPTLDISSTALRRWVGNGRSVRHLVPTAVADYIQRHHLYSPK